jgi:hypothetical protein
MTTWIRIVCVVMSLLLLVPSAPVRAADEKPAEKAADKPAERPASPPKAPPVKPKATSDIFDVIERLEYPELQVIPRASQRLRIEAEEEDAFWFMTHWPIQVSGLATLYVGSTAKSQEREGLSETQKKDFATTATIGQAVGAGWVVAGVLFGMQRPYRTGLNKIAKYADNSPSSALLKERLAEEALERPARFMRAVRWASVLTNFGINVAMASFMTDQGRLSAGVAATLAFLPLVFDDRTIVVYERHQEYKKKIYGPLTSTGVMYDSYSRSLVPSAMLAWSF